MFEAIAAFFLLPFVYWGLLFLMSIVYIVSVENDKYIFSIILTLLGIVIYSSEIVALLSNWQMVLICVGVYALAGAVWSIYRWFRYCKKYIASQEKVIHQKKDWYREQLSPANRKSQITGWIIYWPWSMVWNLVGDFITMIYDALQSVYTKISNSIIEKAIK